MARGPFQGTWQQGSRPTVVHSPDTLVFINGEQDILGCSSCKRRMDFNKFITSVQVDLNVDSVPGSASISMSVPRHTVDDFFFDGNPIITPMMEVEIFAKGFFTLEGVPQYYPIFWGLITEVTDAYSGGEHTVSLNCSDILKWWELCKMNINPAFTQTAGQTGKSIFGNTFFGMNPYDVIWTLAQQAFGDVVVGSGSLTSLYKEASQKETFNHALVDIMLYWQQRFSKIRSNLLLYGTRGNAVRGDILYDQYRKQGPGKGLISGKSRRFPVASQAVRQANGGDNSSQMIYDPTDPNVVAFRTQFMQAGQVNFWQSEYQTKLELAMAAKDSIGFEFFMDVTGDIVFKPPFYNLDILSNKPVSWIQDIDIIDWDFSESEAEVVTQIQVQGSFKGNIDYGFGDEVTPFTSVTDYHLLRKYGWRTQTFNSEFMGAPLLMFYTGLDMLDRYNSKRHRGSVTIPFRPELRLGFPVYVVSKDQIWYISGISHNISFGGRAQTTLSLTAKRSKFVAPRGIGTLDFVGYKGSKGLIPAAELKSRNTELSAKQLKSGGRFKATIGDAAELPPNGDVLRNANSPYEPMLLRHPKTGRIVGHPNVVLMYTRPFAPPPNKLPNVAGQKGSGKNARRAVKGFRKNFNREARKNALEIVKQKNTAEEDDRLREKLMNNRYSYGLNSAGVYTYMHETARIVREVLLMPVKNIEFDTETQKKQFTNKTGMIRPVSDERGFEVIGHWRYGRGVSLRDGSLVINEKDSGPGAANSQAEVGTTLALSGDLLSVLQAQSSGLSTISTGSPNPAEAITKLQPEDLQTAGSWNPDTKAFEFSNLGTNFVETTPFGSPELSGSVNEGSQASVEASQFSRALTLAEMGVREDILADTNCACILGRSDLAFINTGYQLKTLNSAGPANATIGGLEGVAIPGQTEDEQDIFNRREAFQLAAAEGAERRVRQQFAASSGGFEVFAAIENNDPNQVLDNNFKDNLIADARSQAMATAATQFDNDPQNAQDLAALRFNEGVGLVAEALQDGQPVAGTGFATTLTTARVEDFLVGLYRALDPSHLEYEKALRGEFLNSTRPSPQSIRFGQEESPGGVAPPFSPGGRAIGGDPAALALQADSSIDSISETWNKFADNLSKNIEKTEMEQEVKRLTKKVNELRQDCQKLQDAGVGGQALADCTAALNKASQELENTKHKLNNTNATGDVVPPVETVFP